MFKNVLKCSKMFSLPKYIFPNFSWFEMTFPRRLFNEINSNIIMKNNIGKVWLYFYKHSKNSKKEYSKSSCKRIWRLHHFLINKETFFVLWCLLFIGCNNWLHQNIITHIINSNNKHNNITNSLTACNNKAYNIIIQINKIITQHYYYYYYSGDNTTTT